MKRSAFLLIAALLVAVSHQQTCPEDPQVGNPINYVHLFKEQIDADWNFYNTKTSVTLIYQGSTAADTNQQDIVYVLTDSNLPVRQYLYRVTATFDANGILQSIDSFQRIRISTNLTSALGLAGLDASTVADTLLGLPAGTVTAIDDGDVDLTNDLEDAEVPGCCLEKLEYINFYYLFINYYQQGRGTPGPDCTNL